MKLYILGNGFDKAHDLKTDYLNYKSFIEENLYRYPNWKTILDFYPNEKYGFWSDVEKTCD